MQLQNDGESSWKITHTNDIGINNNPYMKLGYHLCLITEFFNVKRTHP